jgi:acetyl-CoA carboxylase biotin carboxyl carrier protein
VSETPEKRRQGELRALLRVLEESGWDYARVELDGFTLEVASDPGFAGSSAPSAPATAPAATATTAVHTEGQRAAPFAWEEEPAVAASATGDHVATSPAAGADGPVETVTSPTIGLFWRSPKPGAPPFVEVGDAVSTGDTVCIIEVMKLMTHVTAPVDGTVRAIRVANGDMVEHGTALIDIAPADATGRP